MFRYVYKEQTKGVAYRESKSNCRFISAMKNRIKTFFKRTNIDNENVSEDEYHSVSSDDVASMHTARESQDENGR